MEIRAAARLEVSSEWLSYSPSFFLLVDLLGRARLNLKFLEPNLDPPVDSEGAHRARFMSQSIPAFQPPSSTYLVAAHQKPCVLAGLAFDEDVVESVRLACVPIMAS